jgi:hypothetical protein
VSQGIKELTRRKEILSRQGRRDRTISDSLSTNHLFFALFEARNNKKARSELVVQIMKGAIDEETFGTNFLGDNTGDWCPIRSCPWHKNTSPDVRADL